jgi:hypothetical protein
MDPVVWLPVAVAEVDHDAGWLTRVDLEIPPWKNPPITESKATGTVSKCACSTQEECPLQTKHISETSLLHQEKHITDHMHVSTVSHEIKHTIRLQRCLLRTSPVFYQAYKYRLQVSVALTGSRKSYV